MQSKREKFTLYIVAGYPLLWLAAFYCYMLVVRFHLGHLPKPMFESSGLNDRLEVEILFVAIWGVLVVPILTCYWLRIRWRQYPPAVLAGPMIVLVAAIAAFGLAHHFDPGRCLEWFYD